MSDFRDQTKADLLIKTEQSLSSPSATLRASFCYLHFVGNSNSYLFSFYTLLPRLARGFLLSFHRFTTSLVQHHFWTRFSVARSKSFAAGGMTTPYQILEAQSESWKDAPLYPPLQQDEDALLVDNLDWESNVQFLNDFCREGVITSFFPDGTSAVDYNNSTLFNDEAANHFRDSGPVHQAGEQASSDNMVISNALQASDVCSIARPGFTYQNVILNEFRAPEVALRLIDQFYGAFDQELQKLLRENVLIQNNKENKVKQNSKSITKTAKIPKNKRTENIARFDSDRYYLKIPMTPAAWGPINKQTGEYLFQYSDYGELTPGKTYSRQEIRYYLANHPLHNSLSNGRVDTKKSKLTLWIQHAPADRGGVYPNKELSSKCRFKECPVKNRTISKGWLRVCFDEQRNPSVVSSNPYHNAGYVHLYCLEEWLDFPQICKDFRVLPDTRTLHEGKNPMAITKEFPSMAQIVTRFIVESKSWNEIGLTRPQNWYHYSLSSLLMEENLNNQPETRARIQAKRGGNNISVHRGDLKKWLKGQEERKAETAMDRQFKGKLSSNRKRKLSVPEEDEEDLCEMDGHLARPFKRFRSS